ncbi:MAG: MATE family efflux transporter [Faecalibacterium sp.]|jgi:putative MATE family efflux protein|nr:MATE family efflux transporter [Faecalibacterium sp.]
MHTETDLLHGSILKSLLLFAAPLFVSNLFQKLYNTVDTMIVGHYLGDLSLAAIGASMSVNDLLIGFAIGIGNGMGIVIAKIYGMRDGRRLRQAVASTLTIGVGVTVIFMLLGEICLRPLMQLLQTPPEIFDEAYSYIHVMVLCIGVMFAYNLFSGLLRAIGNSVMPFLFLLIASVLNIFLDILFVTQFSMGVRGTALATVLAQGVSAVLCLVYILFRCPLLLPSAEDFRYDASLCRELLGQGFSMGLMIAVVSAGTVILQFSINQLGYEIIAAHTAARKLNSFFTMPGMTIALAASTFVSQNRGAGQWDRIRKAVRYSNLICIGLAAVMTAVLAIWSPALMRMISGSSEAVILDNGALYLRLNAPFYSVLGVLLTLRYSLQGMGRKVVPVISSIIELLGKIFFVLALIPSMQYFGVILCEPVIWCLMCAQLAFSFYHDPHIRSAKATPAA